MLTSIPVPVDLDEPGSWKKSVPAALAMGTCFGAKVGLVHVVFDILLSVEAEWSGLALRRILETARAQLRLLADKLKAEADLQTHVATERIFRGILEEADRERADLIVLASHKPEMKDFLIGENAERVVRHARCSVMVIRE